MKVTSQSNICKEVSLNNCCYRDEEKVLMIESIILPLDAVEEEQVMS